MPSPPPPAHEYGSDSSLSSSNRQHPFPLDSDSDDPSFDFQHVQTSTPMKPTRSSRARPFEGGEEDPLHASDTEPLELNEDDIERGLREGRNVQGAAGDRLTRRSLLELSAGGTASRPFAASSSGTGGAGQPSGTQRLLESLARGGRGDSYAPSPSTGSSTLVEDEGQRYEKKRRGGGGEENETTVRQVRLELSRQATLREEDEEDEAGTVLPVERSEDGSSSSPRPRRSRIGNLASYVDAKMSSAAAAQAAPHRRSPKSRRHLPPATPAAPGAYPASARKPAPPVHIFPSHSAPTLLSFAPSSSRTNSSPPVDSSPSAQIHDAFTRLITGPDGALTHAAERRAAFAATATPSSPVSRKEPPTPHPSGYYAFVPSTTLPVERERKNRRRSAEDARQQEEVAARQPSKLERALRQLSQAQRETAAAERSVELEGYFRSDAVRGGAGGVAEDEQGGDAFSSEDDANELAAKAAAQRSAIDFAMARSFAVQEEDEREAEQRRAQQQRFLEEASAEESFSDDQDLRQSARRRAEFRSSSAPYAAAGTQSVRFAEPLAPSSRASSSSRSRSPSPPPTRPASAPLSYPSPRRSTTPPLPPLPPPIVPASPEPARVQPPSQSHQRRSSFLRRSQSFDARASLDPPPPSLREEEPKPLRSTPSRLASVAEQRREREESTTPPAPPRFSSSYSSLAQRQSPAQSPWRTRVPSPTLEAPLAPARSSTSHRAAPGAASLPQPGAATAADPPAADDDEANLTLPHLVSQLSSAVRALAAAQSNTHSSPPSRLNQQGLPKPPPGERDDGGELRRDLERRRKESDRRRRELEGELKEMEQRGQGEGDDRANMLEQLAETYVVEQELGFKVDELRKSIEGMGTAVGEQVAQVVGETIREDTRKRANWFAWVVCIQLALFLLFLRLANSHASSLFETLYYDPFRPALFHIPSHEFYPSSGALDAHLSPETLAALAPHAPSASSAFLAAARSWAGVVLGRVARVALSASSPPSVVSFAVTPS
ncbi:hypothetical protein JCM10213_003421 [Rhodosporidiobolus nylandii]